MMDGPELEPSQLRFTPYSTYHSRFFLLRTSVTICGQQAVIEYTTSGQLTLNCRNPSLSVAFPSFFAKVEEILKKYGVSHVGNFFCEDVPLYQVSFPSEHHMRQFLQVRPRVQTELASLLSATFSEVQSAASHIVPDQPAPTAVQTELFLISPDTLKKDAQVVNVTLKNCSTCMTLWKESELFDFGSLFRVYRLDPSKLPGGGAVTLRALVTELEEVLDWFNFGVHLEVPESDLLAIRYTHLNSRDIKASKTDLFTAWLKSSNQLTWSTVVRALVGIRMEPLARKLAMKFGVTVPPSGEVTSPWRLYTSVQIDPTVWKTLQYKIQEASVEFESRKRRHRLTNNSLEEEKKAAAIARRKIQFAKRRLSHSRSRLANLRDKQTQKIQELEAKKRELHFLQLQLNEQQKGNEELNAIIQNKEDEIRQLHDSVSKMDAEILSAKEEISSLREKLKEATRELEVNLSRVQELERERSNLESTLEWERRHMELTMQSAASANMRTCSAEAQLSCARDQSRATVEESESVTHLAEKDKEIGMLSKRVQALEFQLQEVMGLQTTSESEGALEEQQVDGLVVEISDLRIRLAEAKGEKNKMNQKLEAVQEQQRKMKQWIESLEKMISVDPKKCTAVGAGVQVGETGKANVFKIQLALTSGQPCTTPQQLTVDLRPQSAHPISVVSRSPADYEVSYQPTTRGQHELSVHVNGTQSIQGSPFQVYVRQSPHRLDRPVKVVTGLRFPYCISVGEKVIVSEEKRLSVYSKGGQRLQAVESLRIGRREKCIDPKGVAIDGKGHIYMADSNSNRVIKLNTDLEVVNSVGGRGQFHDPQGLALSKDDAKLFVCDSVNHRIQVLDTELRVLRCFGSRGSGEGELKFPEGVSCDSAGSVYVADRSNGRVQVFSQDGHFLRTISREGPRPSELHLPCSVHVDHDWVYVADSGNGRVSVFTVLGECIASFGEQHLSSVRGITTDEDGLVYVCDFGGSIISF